MIMAHISVVCHVYIHDYSAFICAYGGIVVMDILVVIMHISVLLKQMCVRDAYIWV